MNDKEIGELRRRLRPDRTNITAIRGCYVSDSREILSTFRQSLGLMTEEDRETYLALFKKSLSGAIDRNLLDMRFETKQVADSPEHRLLMALRDSKLEDEAALKTFYETVIDGLQLEGHYLILLAHESYDVPYRGRDGAAFGEASSEVFSYILCAICPVKPSKSALGYAPEEKEFHVQGGAWTASAPEAGFLFPAFDGRRTNLYDALYYTRNPADNHETLVDALFKLASPLPAAEQKEAFQNLLGDALQKECSLPVVQKVEGELRERIAAHKELKLEDPLTIGKSDLVPVLESCGLSEKSVASFAVRFDETFGADAQLSPRNLVGSRLEVRTPDVVIQVNPERGDLLETRVLGGVRYLLVRADENVAVNGVDIEIPE
jgi:hypothetical protein